MNNDQNVSSMEAREKEVVRKIDLRIIPWVGILYLLSFLDRVNIGNARIANTESGHTLEKTLQMTESQFSWSLSVFFFGYVLFEVPSNLLLKKFKPSRWIARIMFTWGIFSTCMAAVTSYQGLLILRLLLGIAEAGFFPGIIFYISFWYKKKEQALRIALFYSAVTLAGAFGGILAYFICQMDGIWGLEGWRWLFLIEGLPSIIFGIATWFYLPDFPSTAAWLTEEERRIICSRLDMVGAEETHFDVNQLISTFLDLKIWGMALIYFFLVTPLYSIAFFVPTIVKSLGFSSITAQLMTVPPYAVAFLVTLGNAYHSDKVHERCFHVALPAMIGALCFFLQVATGSSLIKYILCLGMVSCVYACVPPFLAFVSNNASGSTKAASMTAFVVATGNIGGVIAPQLYTSHDFTFGNITCAIFLALFALGAVGLRQVYYKLNEKLERQGSIDLYVI